MHARGMDDAVLYDPTDTSVGGIHALFITRGDPRQYNLPPKPEVPTIYAKQGWRSAAVGAGLLAGATFLAFLAGGKR
jgi:formate dehydrogenase iron-sulfur subunit